MFAIVKVNSRAEIADMRRIYARTLAGGQEGYLEELIDDAGPFHILCEGALCGYCCIGPDKRMCALYVRQLFIARADELLRYLVTQGYVTGAMVSTRDRLAMSLCLDMQGRRWCQGYLFEDGAASRNPPVPLPDAIVRPAVAADLAAIESLCRHFLPEYRSWIDQGCMHVMMRNNELLGIGLLQIIDTHPPYADVGMFVAPALRRNGIGTYLVEMEKEQCRRRGLIPIAGCDYENIASRRALEKAGMVARDRMVGFEFKQAGS
ncbi:MAG: GNAT family N-acetyltransferase [Chitinivibrionales bacterium]|nr:GNAT family N-acetyltransferase [Chitinivibrionales bacterium]